MPKVKKKRIDIGRLAKQPDGSFDRNSNVVDAWYWMCPGCGFTHSFWMDGRWTFNGDVERPTFSPSLLLRLEDGWKFQCHTFVTDGRIQYLGDCTHALAGQTVELPEIEDPVPQ